MDFFVLKENILWCIQPSLLPTTNITQQVFLLNGRLSSQQLSYAYTKFFFIL